MNVTMGFRNYREFEEAYNNIESEYLLRQNISLFTEMHNYISENIIELPYNEQVFTEAKNIFQKIWDFLVKCWKSIIGVIQGAFSLFTRLVRNSDAILHRLDAIADKQGVDMSKIQQLDDDSLIEVGQTLDQIADHYSTIEPELASMFKNAKGNPNKIKAAIGTLVGISGATAIGTKLLGAATKAGGIVAGGAKAAGAAVTAAASKGITAAGATAAKFGFPNLTYVLGGYGKAHAAKGGLMAGATAIKGSGAAISAAGVSELGAGKGISAVIGGMIDKALGLTSVTYSGIAGALGLGAIGAVGAVAGAEKLINDVGNYSYLTPNAVGGGFTKVKTSQKWKNEQLQAILPTIISQFNMNAANWYFSALLPELHILTTIYGTPPDTKTLAINNDGFEKTVNDLKIDHGKATCATIIEQMNNDVVKIKEIEDEIKKSLFNKTNIIIWRFFEDHTGDKYKTQAGLIENKIMGAVNNYHFINRYELGNYWTHNGKLENEYASLYKDIIDVINMPSNTLDDIKQRSSKTSQLATELSRLGINSDYDYKQHLEKDKKFITFNNAYSRLISTLSAAILARNTVAITLANKNNQMNNSLCKDVEKIIGIIAGLPGAAVGAVKGGISKLKSMGKPKTPPTGTGTGSGAGTP